MKVLLLVCAFVIVGCSSSATQKSGGESKSEIVKTPTEAEMKKTDNKKPQKSASSKESKKSMSKSAAKSYGKMVTCNYGETERVLENKESDNGGCELVYTKEGNANTIANAANQTEYCQEVLDRVANKLANAGFTCQ